MIGAAVVFYYPDLTILERLFTSLSGQIDRVVAVDNTPGPPALPPAFSEQFPYPISYIPLGQNKGIAEAHNIGIRECIRCGCSHVLLLDEDSSLPPGMVKRLLAAEEELLEAGKQVAAIGPQYIDERTGAKSCAIRRGWLRVRRPGLDPRSSEPVETDNLIASGSIIRTAAFESVGMMRDDLFMDFADTEWGLRARSKGYKSYCIPDAVMTHSIGNAAIKAFGRQVYLYSDIRMYYRLRNAMYLSRVSSMGWQWRGYILRWIPYYFFLHVWISKEKRRNARLLLNALWDGLLGRLGPAEARRNAPDMSLDKGSLSLGGRR